MSQIAITGTASAPGGRTVPPLVQSAGERIALRIHRIVILLAFVMIFFPPFNPGRISGEISGNLTLLTSATSFGTITTKLKAFMVPGLRFALNRGDVIQSMIGCAMVLMGVILAAAGACISLGNRKMRRIGVWFPLAGSILILVGLYINRLAYDQMNAYVNGMQIKESFKTDHLEDLALQWPSFARHSASFPWRRSPPGAAYPSGASVSQRVYTSKILRHSMIWFSVSFESHSSARFPSESFT